MLYDFYYMCLLVDVDFRSGKSETSIEHFAFIPSGKKVQPRAASLSVSGSYLAVGGEMPCVVLLDWRSSSISSVCPTSARVLRVRSANGRVRNFFFAHLLRSDGCERFLLFFAAFFPFFPSFVLPYSSLLFILPQMIV